MRAPSCSPELSSTSSCNTRCRSSSSPRRTRTARFLTFVLLLRMQSSIGIGILDVQGAHAPWKSPKNVGHRRVESTDSPSSLLVAEVAFRSNADVVDHETTTTTQSQPPLVKQPPAKKRQHLPPSAGLLVRQKKKTPVHQYHEALQFLMMNPAPEHVISMKQQQRHSKQTTITTTTDTTTRPATRIGLLVNYFRPVLQNDDKDGSTSSTAVIDLDHLLSACHRFERAMVAVGQNMAAKDLRHNLIKVEQFQNQHGHNAHDLRTLLQLELEQSHPHTRGPHGYPLLAESSCAMGLLWIRRSLTFQCRFYRYLTEQSDAQQAALQAYRETLQAVHGWTLQKLHVLGIQSATPERRALLARLGGLEDDNNKNELGKITDEQEQAVLEDLRVLVQVWEPLLERWEEIYEELDLEDLRKV